ncbi:hypothetical protein EQG68_02515 [Flavobacterium piscinae]|uniref:Uncharacterized protein n=1 Tax=Flavobacterium piscinae TaxID=2506424 RepID=A0A4Q1KX32_9FLAO|nr:hypothetical protein [Flavobacterium piscinae]RXR34802.1 hypothetical protein EQG68_02515 [Flavobacterium piscinae]
MNLKVLLILLFGVYISCFSNNENKKNENQDKKSLAVKVEILITKEGVYNALKWFQSNKRNSDYTINENELNRLGYKLLYELKKPEAAIEIFKFNTESFPNSGNAFDSLGEAYLKNNNYQHAIKSYKKAAMLLKHKQLYHYGFLDAEPYSKTVIPSDTLKLFESRGDFNKSTAYVYLQGGPDTELHINAKDALHLMDKDSTILRVYPFQAQMLNPELLITNPVLTEEQSRMENEKSIEILHRTINYLKQRNKKVYLIGHSYGASICLEYIASRNNLADKVVIMGTDLDDNISSWSQLKPGEYIRWEKGVEPKAKKVFGWLPDDFPIKLSFDRLADNLTVLVKNNIQKQYTQSIKEEDFEKLITVYATEDEANGRKSQKEINFLYSKGVDVIEVKGDHHSMLTKDFMGYIFRNKLN